ncbi:unnamed protein product, partial [Candidula unifasciata]
MMNQSNLSTADQQTTDDSLYFLIDYVLTIYLFPLCSLTGIVSNVINMIIFCRLGLKDSMSFNVFSLSLADFLTTYIQSVIFFCCLINQLYPSINVRFLILGLYFFRWLMSSMYLTSCWITAVITIERCFCVVFPFKVKLIFTRLRSVIQSDRVAEGQCVDLSENLVVSTEHSLTVDIINIYVPLFVSVCATVSNIVNIIIFWKLGLKDSMS